MTDKLKAIFDKLPELIERIDKLGIKQTTEAKDRLWLIRELMQAYELNIGDFGLTTIKKTEFYNHYGIPVNLARFVLLYLHQLPEHDREIFLFFNDKRFDYNKTDYDDFNEVILSTIKLVLHLDPRCLTRVFVFCMQNGIDIVKQIEIEIEWSESISNEN